MTMLEATVMHPDTETEELSPETVSEVTFKAPFTMVVELTGKMMIDVVTDVVNTQLPLSQTKGGCGNDEGGHDEPVEPAEHPKTLDPIKVDSCSIERLDTAEADEQSPTSDKFR